MEVFIFSVFNGVLYGMLLFMLASGLNADLQPHGRAQFCPCQLLYAGRLFRLSDFEVCRLLAGADRRPLLVGLIGALVERYGLRPVHKFGHVAELLFTFGLAFVMEEVIQMIWGKVPVPYDIPESLAFAAFTWRGLDYSATGCSCVSCRSASSSPCSCSSPRPGSG